jgi:fructose-1,6-bisphosphatase/inositol monophosphatase family enzyme
MLPDSQSILGRLFAFQRTVRDMILRSRKESGLNEVGRSSAADTIYKIDTEVDPILEEFCEEWGKSTPIVVVAEGLEDHEGNEVESRVFPASAKESDAQFRLIFDPIDGTRGIMYDKRPAWALAGVAPNKGAKTRLRDIEIAVMTELPTSKLGFADVLWAVKGGGANGIRADLRNGDTQPLAIAPSKANTINHGFATITNFFPGTKIVAGELMEHIALKMIGPADVTKATVFEDQYISTGGQFYELIVGHDRFNADLRPIFYRIQGQPEGLCCHPYDCATMLIAEEAGVVLTDGLGNPLDGPLDVTTGISWAAFANAELRKAIEPVLMEFLQTRLRNPGAASTLGR